MSYLAQAFDLGSEEIFPDIICKAIEIYDFDSHYLFWNNWSCTGKLFGSPIDGWAISFADSILSREWIVFDSFCIEICKGAYWITDQIVIWFSF